MTRPDSSSSHAGVKRFPLRRIAARPAALLLILASPWASSEVLWQITPGLEAGVSYETNPDNDSRSSEEDDAYILEATTSAKLERKAAQTLFQFDPKLRFREAHGNDGNSQLDGTDVLLPTLTQYLGRRSQASLRAGYTLLPSREADYQVADPNNPLPPGGLGCDADLRGRCRIDEDQTNWYISPSFDFSFSPRLLLGVGAGYNAIRYSEAELTGRFDYDYYYGNVSLTRVLTEKHRISATLNAARFDADLKGRPTSNETETTGFNLGYEYLFSQATSLTVSGGLSVSEFTLSGRTTVNGLRCLDPDSNEFILCDTKGDDTNFVGEISLRQQLDDTITAQIGISRSIQPNSDGAETTVDQATAYIRRNVTDRWQVSAGATFTKQEAVGAEDLELLRQRFDRDYTRVELSTSWRISRHWSVRGSYAHYVDDQSVVSPLGFGDFSIVSRNNVLALRLSYTGNPIR